ncbi:MAG: FG-GAP-like repeat-containing protein [Phycisphaerales bacterium]
MAASTSVNRVLGMAGLALTACSAVSAHSGHSVREMLPDPRSPGPLYPGQRYPAGDRARDAALGDLNNDGWLDLVLASGPSVRLGLGDGSFGGERLLATGIFFDRVDLVDLNGDGNPDVLASDDEGFTVFLAAGDGTFPESRRVETRRDINDSAVADINGDGFDDVVLARGFFSSYLEVFAGDGDGGFQLLDSIYDHRPLRWIALADLDGDGDTDLVGFHPFSGVPGIVRYNDGLGGLDELQEIGNLDADRVVAADIDGDGDLDLLGCNSGGYAYDLKLIRNLGAREFGDVEFDFLPGAYASTFQVADVNGDGLDDVLTAGTRYFRLPSDVQIFDGRGGGTFAPPRRYLAGEFPSAIALGDVNGDGLIDAVIANEDSRDSSVLLAEAPGRFAVRQELPVGDAPRGLAVADFTGDGVLDALATEADDGDLVLLAGRGAGTFEPGIALPMGIRTRALLTGDLTGDGLPDVAFSGEDEPVAVLAGDGTGGFAAPTLIDGATEPLALHDMDLDGDIDIIAIEAAGDSLVFILNGGDGTFQEPERIFGAGSGLAGTVVVDFNEDSAPDLLAYRRRPGTVFAYRNRGDLRFDTVSSVEIGVDVSGIAADDLDGDGDIDAAVLVSGGVGAVTVIENLGAGGYARGASFPLSGRASPRDIEIVDVDRDGTRDILTASYGEDAIQIFRGLGGGLFEPVIGFDAGARPFQLEIAYLNGNGRPDLVATAEQSDEVAVLLHQWPAVCFADFDDDGRLTLFDFLSFQNAFAGGAASADFDGDGVLTLFDFLSFQNAFDAGCD